MTQESQSPDNLRDINGKMNEISVNSKVNPNLLNKNNIRWKEGWNKNESRLRTTSTKDWRDRHRNRANAAARNESVCVWEEKKEEKKSLGV